MASAFLASMSVPLTPAQETALSELSSELRFLMSENDLPEIVQLRLRTLGHKTMPLFSVLADTRQQVRDLVTRDIVDAGEVGLTVLEVQQAKLISNQVVATWLVASQRLVEEIRISTDNRALRLPMVLSRPVLLSLRQRFEQEKGRTSDHLYPCSSLIERVLEEIEEGTFTALALTEVVSCECSSEESTSLQEVGTVVRIRKNAKPVPLPVNTEELRRRFKTLGIVYYIARFKHTSRLWLRTSTLDTWLEYCEWLLGEDVWGFRLDQEGLQVQTSWTTMLQYDLHIRKLACRKVLFDQMDFQTALDSAREDLPLRARWFITPTAILASTSSSSSSFKRPLPEHVETIKKGVEPTISKKKQKLQKFKEGKGAKKAEKGKGKGGKNRSQFQKTPDGRLVCNFFNSSAGCQRQGCTFVHVCSKCYSENHNFLACQAQ